jgi:Domain of unknown function (DUF6046)
MTNPGLYPIQLNNWVITDIIDPYAPGMNALTALTTPADAPSATSTLGTPVMCAITFEEGNYMGFDGNNYYFPEETLETVLITVTQAKNIVTTAIQGRDGTVKEYIGMGDWQVQINATITSGTNDVYPKGRIANIMNMLNAPIAINVVCWYLQQFNINSLVIEHISAPQKPGSYAQQQLLLSCVSDTPFTIKTN